MYGLFHYFRRRRQMIFYKLMKPLEYERILDVGGDHWFWSAVRHKSHITLLNLFIPEETYDTKQFSYVLGDGRQIPYPDKEFDVVFSNSTIEHVGTFEDQRKFASEIRRTGRRYWVQTPNKWFFMEPHLITPFIHYLPRGLQRKLLQYFTIWGIVAKPSKEEINDFFANTRLLTRKEMKHLFPDGFLYEERFLFFAKSFIAYKASDDKEEIQQNRQHDEILNRTEDGR